jgi:hypothetical protein
VIDGLLESPATDAAAPQGETLAQRAARVARARGGAGETLAERAARIAQARGIKSDAIDLGDSAPAAPAGPRPVVRIGKPVGVGVPEETMVRARSGELGLKPAIAASLAMTRMEPEAAASIQRKVNRIRAPGTASTAANVALSNVVAPLFPKAADAATDAALERYTAGGGDPAAHANLFGAAAMGGEVAGGAALGAATAPGARVVGDVATDVAPRIAARVGRSAVGRVAKHAATSALVNAPLGAITGAAESERPDLAGKAQDALAGARHAAAAGAVAGAGFGVLGEAVGGALAARARRVIAERRGLPASHSPVPPEPLAPTVSPNVLEPSPASAEVRGRVDAMAKAGRVTPPRPVPDLSPDKALRASIAHMQNARHPDVAPEIQELAARRATELRPDLPPVKPGVPPPPEPDDWLTTERPPAPTSAAPADAELATAGGERFSGLPITQRIRTGVRNAYRSAFVTPYAEIEQEAPALAATLNAAGAAPKRAEHIAERRLPLALEGLTEEQRGQFGAKLVHDNLTAEAARKAAAALKATSPDERAALQAAADRFTAHAAALAPRVPAGIETQPWFTAALDKYKTTIEEPLKADALGAGVDPGSLRKPASAYVRLASERRLDDAEIRRALDVAGVADPGELEPRSRLGKLLLGENPALARYFAKRAAGPRAGPPSPAADGPPARVGPSRKTSLTGSAKMATGSAESYATDLDRIVAMDAHDKAVRAARNRVWDDVLKVGRELGEGERAAPGKKVLSFTDTKGLATGESGAHQVEVTPAVYDAVTRFHQGLEGRPQSAAKRTIRGIGSVATRAQISGMPVEATSHMNTLASIVASVPGEKDVAGKALAAIPGQGAKAAAIREMVTIDFSDPATRALENRLADAGALRIDADHGGLINSSHHALFGPEGVDVRGRLVLARKLLDRKPTATNEELRQFITGKLGNYVKENSGAVTNAMQESGVSAFARFQAARIPTSVKAVVGQSGLPASSKGQRIRDVANTLYRGPVGHVIGANLVNAARTGHSTFANEKGHDLDVDTGLYAVNGTIKHLSPEEAKALGEQAAPLYIPGGTLNPVAVGGLRSSGLRALLLSDRGATGRVADAARDYTNTGLGVMSPAGRFLFTALTGKVPYVSRGGDFMKTVDAGFNKDREQGRRVKAALAQANPALHAYAETGGGGRTLGQALEHGDAPLGGFGAAAAKTAEFLMPRVLTPGVGGRSNEQSIAARDQREFKDAMSDYTRRVRNANTPTDALKVIDEAVDDARSDGRFEPELVRRQLRKALMLGPEPSDDDVGRLEESTPQRLRVSAKKREQSTQRFQQRSKVRPIANP